MKIDTHLWHAELKGKRLHPIVCRENLRQGAPIAYCARLLKTITNMISMDTYPGKVSFYMDIDMSRYILQVFQISASIDYYAFGKFEQVGYLLFTPLLRSVISPVLDEYESKWASVAMTSTSSIDLQNWKRFSLPELLWKWRNENSYSRDSI